MFKKIVLDKSGSMAIETAIVAPTLIMMTLGIFEVGMVVSRQHELQSAANEGEIIAIATNSGAETDIEQIRYILKDSVQLSDENLTITRRFRCGTSSELVNTISECMDHEVVSSYLKIDIRETYNPRWTAFGIGQPISFSVQRMVQLS